MPLVLGMVLCLLLLGGGVAAATSAFTARSNLQHVCDGAAAAAAEATQRSVLSSPLGTTGDTAHAAATNYIAQRGASATIGVSLDGDWVRLQCEGEAVVMFGATFGADSITMTVSSVARAVLPPAGT